MSLTEATREQAPAGWYPDGYGNERYWDGTAWTEHLRKPAGADATVATAAKRDGAFAKVGAAVKKAAADKQTANEARSLKHAEAQQAAGNLVTSAVFGRSTVEVYEGGYVRVAPGITRNTPYEKLRSIDYAPPKDKSSRTDSAAAGLMKREMSNLIKGGVGGLMKSGMTDLVVGGLQELAAAAMQESVLTIATDKDIHTLIDEGGRGRSAVGTALEAAGNSVITDQPGIADDLATRGVFGTATVELFEGGYVRVTRRPSENVPYEKLRSITFTSPSQETTSGIGSALVGGSALATGLMKGRIPGMVSEGLRRIATVEAPKSYLTITTDRQIHALVDEGAGISEVGMALEAAGNALIAATQGAQPPVLVSDARSAIVGQAPAGPTATERLRQMADLHKDGILSDEEFATAKAKLLSEL